MKNNKEQHIEEVKLFVIRLLALLILLGIMFGWVFGLFVIKNDDMKPSLKAGDLLLYYRLNSTYKEGDLVVYEQNKVKYVGRIIAKSGDEVNINGENQLMINGHEVMEPDIYQPTPKIKQGIDFPTKVTRENYFILSDARQCSKDSRYFGQIAKNMIKGRVMTAVRRNNI